MAINPIWEGIFAGQQWGKYPSEELVRFMARNFKSGRVLEVGCGPGANVWYLAREGFRVSGIDGSESAIREAGRRLTTDGLSAELVVGDAVLLPWEDDTFDAVLDLEAAYANPFEDARMIYDEMARVCRPGGRLFALAFAGETDESVFADRGYFRLASREDIPLLIRGFRIDDVSAITRRGIKEWVITGTKP